ncbi:MAG: tetratricopeptide repeat protein [Pseudomonadota bacterium]
MFASINRTKLVPLGMTGALALAIAASAGFSEDVVAKQAPDKTASAAQSALSKGQVDKAIELAEALVAASPREPSYRALLAHAYLKAGRFQSASATFDDAMKLGDNSAKTALGLALSYSAAGRHRDAVAILEDWRDAIPVADLGLALALAGEPTRGSAVLADALRNGENTPKLRQNLAYAYALDGRWREARIMMMQDVPADQIDARISDWAAKTRPEDNQLRVAGLLGAPLRSDPGQPSRLALNSNPVNEQLAAQTAAVEPVQQVAAAELPPVAKAEPVAALASYTPVTAPVAAEPAPVQAPSKFAAAFAEPAAAPTPTAVVDASGRAFISQPVVQAVPARQYRAPRGVAVAPVRTATRRVAYAAPVPTNAPGTHMVQLGSFFTQQGARRAWGIYTAKNPELRGFRMTITQAQVRGKTYFRVAAAGINGSQGAWGLCGTVKARGMGCFAYAARTGVPGTKAPAATQMARAKVPAPAPKAAPAAPALARKR